MLAVSTKRRRYRSPAGQGWSRQGRRRARARARSPRRTCNGPIAPRPATARPRSRRKASFGPAMSSMSSGGRRKPTSYRLRQPPKVQGGLVAMDPQDRPRSRHGRRLLLRPVRIQPRDAGDAPAGIVLQAVRLRGGAGQRLYAGVRHHRRAVRDRQTGGQVWRRKTMAAGRRRHRRCASASRSRAT